MKHEARQHLTRIAANYIRLFSTVALGILLVRLLGNGVGADGLGLFFLMGSSVGIASMIQDIVRQCMIRELGEAWHSDNPDRFPEVYNTAMAVCLVIGLFAAGLLVVLALAIEHILQIPDSFVHAARVFIIAKAFEVFFTIASAPPINIYIISERFVAFNIWTIMSRLTWTLAAAIVFLGIRPDLPAKGFEWFGILSTVLYVTVTVGNVAALMRGSPLLRPRPSRVTRSAFASLFQIGGWNTGVAVADALHLRTDSFIMNFYFGVVGNFLFGIAQQFISYVWRLCVGVMEGLEAISVRLSTDADRPHATRSLLRHSTRLQTLVAVPAGILMSVYATTLMRLWIPLEDGEVSLIPRAGPLVAILAVGITVRSITGAWMRILYGSGHVRAYAPLVLAGGLCNPVLAVFLIWLLPDGANILGPSISFSIIYVLFHFILFSFVTGRCLGISASEVIRPTIAPALCAAFAAISLPFVNLLVPRTTFAGIVAGSLIYGSLCGVLAICFVLTREERIMILRLLRHVTRPRLRIPPPKEPALPTPTDPQTPPIGPTLQDPVHAGSSGDNDQPSRP